MRTFTGVVLTGLLLLVQVSGHSGAVGHHRETAVVWPLFFSTILLSFLLVLCLTPRTAPWLWPIVNPVFAGVLAMQWVTLTAGFEPDESNAHYRLFMWIGIYLAVSGILYVLAMSEIHISAPSEAFAWIIATAAGGFCASVLPDEVDWVTGVGVLLTEQLIFYFVWILPRTLEQMSLDAWSVGDYKLGVSPRPDDPVAVWRAECDGVLWGAAPMALAGSFIKLLTIAVTHLPHCHKDDLCAWDGQIPGRCSLWFKITVAIVLVTATCATPLQKMVKQSTGLKNIASSTLLSGLTKAISMSLLNVIRSGVSYNLCFHLDICDMAKHRMFILLMIAYASTLVAMLSALMMGYVEDWVAPGSVLHTIMVRIQASVGLQCGIAWGAAFTAGAGSGALDKLGLGGGVLGEADLAILLAVTILPHHAYFIRPAKAKADAEHAERQAAKAGHSHQH